MKNYFITIKPFGTHAVLIEWPDKVEENILDDILTFSNYLNEHCLTNKVYELVPAYNSLTVILRNETINFVAFKKQLLAWYNTKSEAKKIQKYLWRFPVCYDDDFGIDLNDVAAALNKTKEEIIALHTSTAYTVYGIGFLPGFMYLGGLSKALEIPRRETPRLKVLKGAVGLAGKQTGVYPQQSPGGWNIIGNCSVPIFNTKNENPCLVKVGDKVQFYQISKASYDLTKIESEVGIYKPEKIKIDA
ncbi:5-oxoprolinase subunit PxpB [Cellulophaga baltica]|uniref:5-oxoprolinase subunit PxpB n=1 Tax=Cellulophaga TaxID=104264 RepID=UPI001C07A47F|nr:5-oxoprolinase subunit PxpB [Cellulophaga sp. 1_MG-2023]MBU2997515.1 5-oxoprolinase subunit PxpB [Cellulophaga baltica]MDO6768910.1 5-oxoprolinase subunit PxpB [Cellulophaga sp. 1_MG-2023]